MEELYFEEEAARTAPELEQFVERGALALLGLDLAVLLRVREQGHHVLHQMPIPAPSTNVSMEPSTTLHGHGKKWGRKRSSNYLNVMRREQVTSTFSLLRNGGAAGDATAEAGSASGAGGSLKPKSVRSGRSGAVSSGFSAAAASAGALVRFRFFAMGVPAPRRRREL